MEKTTKDPVMEMIEKEIEQSAANYLRNILGQVGSYIYGTRAKTYEQSAVKTMAEIEFMVDEFNRLYLDKLRKSATQKEPQDDKPKRNCFKCGKYKQGCSGVPDGNVCMVKNNPCWVEKKVK